MNDIQLDLPIVLDGSVHDAHDSHFSSNPTCRLSNNYDRAIDLYRKPIVYPDRVRVWTIRQVAGESQD